MTDAPRPDDYSRDARCPFCRLTPGLCVCGDLPRIETGLRVLLILHAKEKLRQSNTGMLAHRMLVNSEACVFGSWDEEFPDGELRRPDTDYLVLHPLDDAQVLTPELAAPRPGRTTTLVVLDGTWHQARRITKRVPGLAGLPYVRLPDDVAETYQPRRAPRPGHYSTAGAIAHALRCAGEGDAAATMESALESTWPRLMHVRGKRKRDELAGG